MGADLFPGRPEDRRALRAFVKVAHPDLGGDPEVFLAGLRRWQLDTASRRPPANVVFYRRRRGAARLASWWPRRRPRRRRVR